MPKSPPNKAEKRRLAMLAEAQALGIPAFMTSAWRNRYAKAA